MLTPANVPLIPPCAVRIVEVIDAPQASLFVPWNNAETLPPWSVAVPVTFSRSARPSTVTSTS